MNVASHQLCEELYAVSGWYFGDHKWHHSSFNDLWTLAPAPDKVGKTYLAICPAYDLGYLLRKLVQHVKVGLSCEDVQNEYLYGTWSDDHPAVIWADSPEAAAAKLAIELFKQGILKKENTDA